MKQPQTLKEAIPSWIPIAKFAAHNNCSRQHVYRAIRSRTWRKHWKIDANGQYVIRADAPAPLKHSAGRKAEIKLAEGWTNTLPAAPKAGKKARGK